MFVFLFVFFIFVFVFLFVIFFVFVKNTEQQADLHCPELDANWRIDLRWQDCFLCWRQPVSQEVAANICVPIFVQKLAANIGLLIFPNHLGLKPEEQERRRGLGLSAAAWL